MSTNTKKHRQKAAGIDGGSSSNHRQSHMEKVKIPESERLPLQLKISDFLASSDDEIILKGLSNTHRKYLHQYAARLGLKSQSYGNKNSRELHIRRRKRLTTLGDVRPLNMSAATRTMLQSLLPTIQTQLVTNQVIVQSNPSASHRYRNLRGDSISVALGPRMIPPRSQRISNELFRDKQELPIFHYQGELNQMLKQHNVSLCFFFFFGLFGENYDIKLLSFVKILRKIISEFSKFKYVFMFLK